MGILSKSEIDASKFSWEGNSGSSFASDLRLPVGDMPSELLLVNQKRGTQVKFGFHEMNRDRDGDIRYFLYKSAPWGPNGVTFTITIFNT